MKVLINWLKDHLDIDEDIKVLAEKLTMSGFEVEGVRALTDEFKNVKVGRVINIYPHPDGGKLKVCDVSIGDEVLKVICGAPNVEINRNVVIALPGSDISGGRVEKTAIRGVESYGMLCSEKELGLALHSDGIILLPEKLSPGKFIWEEAYPDLDDYVLDISVTPNRGDCLSHIGIAREIAAITGKKLKKDAVFNPQLLKNMEFVEIKIDAPDLCPRYTAKLIKNVKIKPSPDKLKARLSACGMRPINNVVDITNYIMLDLGQPLHAFDYALIEEKTVIVRKAGEKETFATLDGKERELLTNDLVIADKNRAIALAGVMGGANSEVTENTRDILLESAFFNPAAVRKTAKRLGMQSEASYRFERGVDIQGAPLACEKAAIMMGMYAEGEVVEGVLDCNPAPYNKITVKFRPERCTVYLGNADIAPFMERRLNGLGFNVNKKRFEWDVEVPSYRTDTAIEEDLYEEIARLGFYEEIQTVMPAIKMQTRSDLAETNFRAVLRNALVDFGAVEVITYSFIAEKELKKILYPENAKAASAYIKNPLAEESTVMRPTLISSHLTVAELNHARQNYNFILFETGKKYCRIQESSDGNKSGFSEKNVLSLVFSGLLKRKTWHCEEMPFDFLTVKGIMELFLKRVFKMNLKLEKIKDSDYPFLHPVESGGIIVDAKNIGFVGSVHPDAAANYDLKRDVYVVELDMDMLKRTFLEKKPGYYGLSKYPSVERDITVIVDEHIDNEQVMAVIFNASGELLKNVKLVDLFRGEKIGGGKKSMTYRLIYQSGEKTLSDEEVNEENEKIAKELLKQLKVEFSK